MSGGAVVFRAPDSEAELRVFLEPGDEGTRKLSREAKDFLVREHPGAKISDSERLRLGGDPARRLVARWPGGEETAAVLSVAGYSYLLVARLAEDAGATEKREAAAALSSFQAL
jgi:hypothetical protein